ncbi:MAG: tyrosine--tRNA ligase [Candidatus Paceibacterota bacterium]
MKIATDLSKIEELLSRGVEELVDEKNLKEALLSGKQLRVKLGIDPTGKKIHLGRATQLWKLKDFQDLGHKIILIIGDFTATIGDASDKEAMRKVLSKEEVEENMVGYLEQLGKIINLREAEVHYNSEWHDKLSVRELISITQKYTAQQMIQRRNFKERWEQEKPIGLHEIFYPIFQGYDSVAIKADVELGGQDQLFNLQAGRFIQELYKQKPQNIMMLKMIWGLDGRKMSTSWGNVINITDEPNDMFGKIMSMRDEYIIDYFITCTRYPFEKIKVLEDGIKNGQNPRDTKALLAQEIVSLYYGQETALKALGEFENIFKNKEIPQDIPEVEVTQNKINIVDLIILAKLAESKQEARRLIEQGGVRLKSTVIENYKQEVDVVAGDILQVGKRRFIKIK